MGICLVAGEGLEPTVLHFLCGENAAVGSAALTAHRAVIHSRLTLRVMSGSRGVSPGVSGAFRPFRLWFSFRLTLLFPLSPPPFFLLWVRIWVKALAHRYIWCADTAQSRQRSPLRRQGIRSLHAGKMNGDIVIAVAASCL